MCIYICTTHSHVLLCCVLPQLLRLKNTHDSKVVSIGLSVNPNPNPSLLSPGSSYA